MKPIPISVFTGYIGSGKTTIILDVIKQMPKNYNVVWLKNEFGDVKADSELAKENNIDVKEMINGCLCCVLVGKIQNALKEILEKYSPDRIIIETSGSAYPAPIAWEIRKMPELFKLDSIITVIDAINFTGYEDKSYTAKMQTQYTDMILINKHEGVSPEQLDQTLDDVYELNLNTPKIKTDHGHIDANLIFGLDTQLFSEFKSVEEEEKHKVHHHHVSEVEVLEVKTTKQYTEEEFGQFLGSLLKRYFYRIKGMINTPEGKVLLFNYVFGRFDFQPLEKYKEETKIVFMGKDIKTFKDKIAEGLGIEESEILEIQ